MNWKKLLCALLCAVVALSCFAFAEEEDKDARIAELEAQVAQLQAENETLQGYRRQMLLAEFDGGEILLSDAQEEYDYYESMYASYGMSLADIGYDTVLKEEIANVLIEDAILYYKAQEMGLDQVDEETRQTYEEQATQSYSANVESYATNYFSGEGISEEEATQAAVDYLNEAGYTYDYILENLLHNHAVTAVREQITKDIVATEEDILATYDEMVAADEEAYGSSAYQYETARTSGATVAWNPEGYRQVKHILFKFDDDQAARYSDLISTKESLETEMIALEDAEAAAAESTESTETAEEPEATEAAETSADLETTEATETAQDPETTEVSETSEATEEEVHRSREEIEADIAAVDADLDALYNELMPEVEAAIGRFEAGEDIDTLIEELGEDPGMTTEPGLSEGYVVAENSASWDPAFTEGAMSIPEIGGLSEPVRGSYGIHLIYYMADVPAGPVDLESIREAVADTAQNNKVNDAYLAMLDTWKEELHLVTYMENFI